MIFTKGTKLITAPASEPIDTDTAKEWLRVDTTADDTLIASAVASARSHIENMSSLALFTQTVRDVMDGWPEYEAVSNPYQAFYLKRYPVQSITNIQYIDSDGNTQTLSTDVYAVDTNGIFTRIALKANQSWPDLRDQIAAVTINYVAGWSATSSIPSDLIMALKLLLAFYYDNRSDTVHQKRTAAENLISKHYVHAI